MAAHQVEEGATKAKLEELLRRANRGTEVPPPPTYRPPVTTLLPPPLPPEAPVRAPAAPPVGEGQEHAPAGASVQAGGSGSGQILTALPVPPTAAPRMPPGRPGTPPRPKLGGASGAPAPAGPKTLGAVPQDTAESRVHLTRFMNLALAQEAAIEPKGELKQPVPDPGVSTAAVSGISASVRDEGSTTGLTKMENGTLGTRTNADFNVNVRGPLPEYSASMKQPIKRMPRFTTGKTQAERKKDRRKILPAGSAAAAAAEESVSSSAPSTGADAAVESTRLETLVPTVDDTTGAPTAGEGSTRQETLLPIGTAVAAGEGDGAPDSSDAEFDPGNPWTSLDDGPLPPELKAELDRKWEDARRVQELDEYEIQQGGTVITATAPGVTGSASKHTYFSHRSGTGRVIGTCFAETGLDDPWQNFNEAINMRTAKSVSVTGPAGADIWDSTGKVLEYEGRTWEKLERIDVNARGKAKPTQSPGAGPAVRRESEGWQEDSASRQVSIAAFNAGESNPLLQRPDHAGVRRQYVDENHEVIEEDRLIPGAEAETGGETLAATGVGLAEPVGVVDDSGMTGGADLGGGDLADGSQKTLLTAPESTASQPPAEEGPAKARVARPRLCRYQRTCIDSLQET